MVPGGARTALMAAALAAGALGAVAPASADHVLLTDELRLVRGRLLAIGGDSVAYRDIDGQTQTIPAKRCLGLFDPDVSFKPAPEDGVLIRADGQRLPGRPELRQGKLVWTHQLLGMTAIDLEATRSIVFGPERGAPRADRTDVVLLANGDILEGIIDRLGANIDIVQGDGADARKVAVPLERVAAVALVAPAKAPAGARTWLADGTILDSARPLLERGDVRLPELAITGEQKDVVVPLANVRGIAFDPGAFTPLAALRIVSTEAPPERYQVPAPVRVDPLAPLGVSSLRLSGPASFLFEPLAADGLRLVATIRLAPEGLPWGDLEIAIVDSEGECWRGHLGSERRSLPVDVTLRGRKLSIVLEEGRNGAIGDTVLIESAILGAPPAAPSATAG
ncbi:MAG: hypothetical protein U0575_06065 [Phycisphaerales bacterium]